MAKKKAKRSGAPAFWKLQRKAFHFIVRTAPGPHPKAQSYPLAVLVRDVLKLVKTYREARAAIHDGKIIVDGVERRVPDFPVGLMDVISIPSIGKSFRLVPKGDDPLHPLMVSEEEKQLKLCKVKTKTTVKGAMVQYGLHDGRSILFDDPSVLRRGDGCLIEVPSQKLLQPLKLEKGTLVVVTKGQKVGQIGRVEEVRQGTFSRPSMVGLSVEGASIEVPVDSVFVVGKEKPLIKIG